MNLVFNGFNEGKMVAMNVIAHGDEK